MACGILVPQPGIEPMPPALEVQSLNHWTTRGVPFQPLNCIKEVLGFPGGPVVKNPPAKVGDVRDVGSSPRSGRSPGVGNGYPRQYSCLENSMVRGAWRATARGAAESQT